MNKRCLWAGVSLASLIVTSCASVIEPVPEASLIAAKTADIPAQWQISNAPIRAESFAALYDDPALSDYLTLASEGNYDLEQARLRVSRAEAQLDLSESRRGPSVNSSLGASASEFLGSIERISESVNLGLSAGYDPDLFGQLKNDVESAQARLGIARADEKRLRRVILSGVISAYVNAVEAQLQLAVAEQNLEFLKETERVTRARFEAGDIAGSDLALSELEFQSARANVAEQRFAAADARRALSILIGGFGDSDLTNLPVLAQQLPNLSGVTPGLTVSPSDAVLSRYDVKAARLGVIDAAAQLEAIRADDLPSASITSALSGGRPILDLLDIDTYIASIAASLSYNIFDGGANKALQDDAEAALDTQLSFYAETLRTALRDMDGSVNQAEALAQSLNALQSAETAAERALELESIRFDLGESILLDVLTVQRRVDGIRSARLRTQRRYLEAIARAHLALGPGSGE
jgi:NodT family efflux transporter outer membrane factor (OMF) lipoprotein